MADLPAPESTPWGWKALIISCIVGAIFLAFIYLAVNTEADYMPSQQHKNQMQQHAMQDTASISPEASQKAQQDHIHSAEVEKNMPDSAHAEMDMSHQDHHASSHEHE